MVTVRKPWTHDTRVLMTVPSDDLRDIGWVEGDKVVVRNTGEELTIKPLPEVENPERFEEADEA